MSDSVSRYEPGKDEHGVFMRRTGDGQFVLYASYLGTKARAEKAEAERDRLGEIVMRIGDSLAASGIDISELIVDAEDREQKLIKENAALKAERDSLRDARSKVLEELELYLSIGETDDRNRIRAVGDGWRKALKGGEA